MACPSSSVSRTASSLISVSRDGETWDALENAVSFTAESFVSKPLVGRAQASGCWLTCRCCCAWFLVRLSALTFLQSAVTVVDPVDSDLLLFLLNIFLLLLDGVDLGPRALVAPL